MKEALKFLQDCGTFYLATDDNGQPRVRPFGAVAEFEGKLYITTNNQKDVYHQMLKNPKVEMSGTIGGQWIRVTGEVKEDTRREARVAMMDANPSLSGMYDVDDGKFTVLYFTSGTATIYSFTEEPKTFTL